MSIKKLFQMSYIPQLGSMSDREVVQFSVVSQGDSSEYRREHEAM